MLQTLCVIFESQFGIIIPKKQNCVSLPRLPIYDFPSIICISSRQEVFCKERCSEKFRKIHRKAPVPEYLF